MGYLKVEYVIPKELIEKIQEYVNGEFIYIPRKDGCQKAWGEKSGARSDISQRNSQIFEKYNNGLTADELADEYYLSVHSIRRIVYNERKAENSRKSEYEQKIMAFDNVDSL